MIKIVVPSEERRFFYRTLFPLGVLVGFSFGCFFMFIMIFYPPHILIQEKVIKDGQEDREMKMFISQMENPSLRNFELLETAEDKSLAFLF